MALEGVEALIFDVFGTTVDWRSSVTKELVELGQKHSLSYTLDDWQDFAAEWRKGYMTNTYRIANGGSGTNDVDTMHREILDALLGTSRWTALASVLDEPSKAHLNHVWHRLKGWPDTVQGLYDLKKHVIIASLSNGNVRLLVDMAKHADLPWDAVFSGALFDTYKPNPAAYQGALKHLSLSDTPHKAAMVAAHIFDIRGAAKAGLKTVYIPRPGEDPGVAEGEIKSKDEGGEVDLVVGSLVELAKVLEK